MKKTFIPTTSNSITLTGIQGGKNGQNFPKILNGNNGFYRNHGIFILIPVDTSKNCFGASGHAGIYTTPPLTHYYFNEKCGVQSVALWLLP